MSDRAEVGAAKALISNGFSKFEVAYSAEEVERAGRLERYLTGSYPTAFWRNLLKGREWRGGVGRFLDRATRLPDVCVEGYPLPEFVYFAALGLPGPLRTLADLQGRLLVQSFEMYGASAMHAVEQASRSVRIYHYRSGFGGRSIAAARARGMVLLCEHSIADPLAVDYLVSHGGRLPDRENPPPLSRFWKYIARECDAADYIVANSDFVKKTMVAMGRPAEKIFVLYRGSDDGFIAMVDDPGMPVKNMGPGTLRLLFAGAVSRRKGIPCLRAAVDRLKSVDGWSLTIAGPVESDCQDDYQHMLADPRISGLGPLPRRDLARAMRQADVFVFPTLAEGSARVVFEALASGCYVVTTENSGSIAGTHAHGDLITPQAPDQLAETIRRLIGERERVLKQGTQNAALIRERFRQSTYGKKLLALYDQIAPVPGKLS